MTRRVIVLAAFSLGGGVELTTVQIQNRSLIRTNRFSAPTLPPSQPLTGQRYLTWQVSSGWKSWWPRHAAVQMEYTCAKCNRADTGNVSNPAEFTGGILNAEFRLRS